MPFVRFERDGRWWTRWTAEPPEPPWTTRWYENRDPRYGLHFRFNDVPAHELEEIPLNTFGIIAAAKQRKRLRLLREAQLKEIAAK
jgi:hypothetical protein